MNILDLIIPRFYDIAIFFGIISLCYALWLQGKYYGEDLTMEEKQDNFNRKLPTLCEECGNTTCGEMDICHGCINRCVCLAKKEKENLTMEENQLQLYLKIITTQKSHLQCRQMRWSSRCLKWTHIQ